MSETMPDSVAEPSVRQVSVDAATIINNNDQSNLIRRCIFTPRCEEWTRPSLPHWSPLHQQMDRQTTEIIKAITELL